MGPVILITLGVLFLLNEYSWIRFRDSCPVLLIVVGLLLFAARSGSIEGHIQPSWMASQGSKKSQDEQTTIDPQPTGGIER